MTVLFQIQRFCRKRAVVMAAILLIQVTQAAQRLELLSYCSWASLLLRHRHAQVCHRRHLARKRGRFLGMVAAARIAIGETVILLTLPLPLAGVSIDMARKCKQNDRTLADGQARIIEDLAHRHARAREMLAVRACRQAFTAVPCVFSLPASA